MTVNSDESPYEMPEQMVSTENINVANTWSNTIERVLDKLRINCCQLSNFHKYKYQHAKSQIKWFRIPIIILSGINTFASVGLHEFVKQSNVSIISSGISLICGIITGIEMFMKYQDKMEIELSTHKEYYRISIDIYKMISIDRSQRKITGKDFLDEKFNEYEKIKSRSRPEEPSDLVYDILSDMEELLLYKRGNSSVRGWVNKIELPPPLHSKVSKSLGVSYDRLRNPEKYALREQSRTLENNVKITQKYIDQQWIDKKERELLNREKEESGKINDPSHAIAPSHIEREHDEFLYDKHHRHTTLKNRLTNMFIVKNTNNIELEEDEDIVNEPTNNNLELKIDIDDDEREEVYRPHTEKITEFINEFHKFYNRKPAKDEITDHLKDSVNNDVLDNFFQGYMC